MTSCVPKLWEEKLGRRKAIQSHAFDKPMNDRRCDSARLSPSRDCSGNICEFPKYCSLISQEDTIRSCSMW